MSSPLLLRASEAAELLAVSRSKLYELVAIGALPVVRVGRSIRIHRATLEARLAREAEGPASGRESGR